MNILTIAGSDPSSGAGIQNDIKTFSSLGAYGLCVVTAITSQNTKKFSLVEKISAKMIESQLDSIMSDFNVAAIKIGMVYSSDVIKIIYDKLKSIKIPIILDPVIESTTGGILLQKNAFNDFKKLLLPISYGFTPNVSEAEKISGLKIKNEIDAKKAAKWIQSLGTKNVIITGFLQGDKVTDFVLDGKKFYSFSSKKIPIKNHGSGCTFSATLAVFLAEGNNLRESVKQAKEFTTSSIKFSQKIGRGIAIVSAQKDRIKKLLEQGLLDFTKIKDSYKIIPEVGTNFVFSNPCPESISDIVGISGRIVRSFDHVIVAGSLEYGGSHHVGGAMLEVSKKFPLIQSAINVRFDEDFIKKAQKLGFSVSSYSRQQEPKSTKLAEGKTISWGMKMAVSKSKKAPDMIFHKGDLGKEPMIILFGKNPREVLYKLTRIL